MPNRESRHIQARSGHSPVVAVVGCPNVGKSTLVNRITRTRDTIVQEQPGVTRDRKTVEAVWKDRRFMLVDTGGWSPADDVLKSKVNNQSERAINSADAILFVVDARIGLTNDDASVAQILRTAKVPVFVVANKVDHESHGDLVWDFLGLGMGEPHLISALHGTGVADLLDSLLACFDDEMKDQVAGDGDGGQVAGDGDHQFTARTCDFSVVLVGRPNAGKSTLFNRLIGDELSIVHDQPGTTRDSIDTVIKTEIGLVRFVDTAGMRRLANVDSPVEYYSVIRTLRAIEAIDIAVVVIDAAVGITRQDQRIVQRVDSAGCPILLLLNKWDLLNTEARMRLTEATERKFGFLGRLPVLRISALSGRGVTRLWPLLKVAVNEYRSRIPTSRVNQIIQTAQSAHSAPGGARILYAVQGATNPPTFTLFVNRMLPRTYLRYIKRYLQESLDLSATSVKLRVRHHK